MFVGIGKGLSLNGSDAYVEIAHDDSLNVGAEHKIALWFKLDKPPVAGTTVVTEDDWAPGFWWDGTIIRHHTHDPSGTLHYTDDLFCRWHAGSNIGTRASTCRYL